MRRRWIYRNGEPVAEYAGDELVWASDTYYEQDDKDVHHVMPDIKPYRSMVDGSIIEGRAQHRAHLKAHGLIEYGNEMKHMMRKRDVQLDRKAKESRRQVLAAMVDKHRR